VEKVQLLERSRAIRVLLVLRTSGPIGRNELYERTGKSPHVSLKRVEELIREGLIVEEKQEAWPFTKYLTLSERGRAVANALAEAERVLGLFAGK
jgi:DNA-binding MarR family transcriptional regulator